MIFEIRNYWIYLTFENQHLLDRVMVPWDLSRTAPQCSAVREDRERSLDDAPHTALASSQLLIATSLSECRKQIMKCMQYEQMNFPQLAPPCGSNTIDQPRLLMNVGASRWRSVGLRQRPVLPALSQLLQHKFILKIELYRLIYP